MSRVAALLLLLGGLARAQHPGTENTPDQCNDHLDNDGDGYVDCEDVKCHNIGQCRALEVASTGDEKMTPRGQMIAGAIMIVIGPAIAAGSSAVFLDAIDQPKVTKSGVEYAVGSVMAAAGLAIGISGAVLLKRGLKRHQEDVEMGLALGPMKLGLRVTF